MKAAGSVAAAMVGLTLVMTWPLGAALTSSLPGGYGEPLLAIWGIGWVTRAIGSAIGHPSTIAAFWNANIFHPEPQALTFSEPYIGQSLLLLPVSWLSGNPILSYNVAFLLTFALTGIGTFLLVRSLYSEGSSDPSVTHAATVAGVTAAVIVAFSPQRLRNDIGDLHALSMHWLPWTLLGLHRYLATDSRVALALTCAAAIGLALSSLAVMAGSVPVLLLFAVVDAGRRKRWHLRVWFELWAAAAGVVLVTMAILLPYLEMQRRLGVSFRVEVVTPAALVLSVLAGLAAGALVTRWPRRGMTAAGLTLAAYLALVRPSSIPLDRPLVPADLAAPSAALEPSAQLPSIYAEVRTLSSDAVVLELPFGDSAYELRYLFFAAAHGRRLVNGYAEAFPASYLARQRVLANPLLDPERTAQALAVATHVIVHRAAWRDDRGDAIARQLDSLGGTLIARHDDTLLYQMQAAERLARGTIE